jgi:hypothetical protein
VNPSARLDLKNVDQRYPIGEEGNAAQLKQPLVVSAGPDLLITPGFAIGG